MCVPPPIKKILYATLKTHLQVPQFSLPGTATLVCRAVDVERENLALGKVVFEQLMDTDSGVVHRTPWTCLSVERGEGERENKRERWERGEKEGERGGEGGGKRKRYV